MFDDGELRDDDGLSWLIVGASLNDGACNASDMRDFWERAVGDEAPSEKFVRGFAEGVKEIFEKL
ncbi:hypothetical protein [Sinimarinibacterium flocculans]|uniref:Uncharacterized protein n=1 Tax=Sinimarinibacterium flocculans TaxID=985250 RepID=A0A318E3W8_9GAMM|nr:hypothetical protein [Sinimarinibacterium flocculans]PXV65812.1 hypothetical protein C8D93_109192 [Sinimarinibacterium flocculans]